MLYTETPIYAELAQNVDPATDLGGFIYPRLLFTMTPNPVTGPKEITSGRSQRAPETRPLTIDPTRRRSQRIPGRGGEAGRGPRS